MLPVLDSLQSCDPIFHFFSIISTQDELPARSDDLEKGTPNIFSMLTNKGQMLTTMKAFLKTRFHSMF